MLPLLVRVSQQLIQSIMVRLGGSLVPRLLVRVSLHLIQIRLRLCGSPMLPFLVRVSQQLLPLIIPRLQLDLSAAALGEGQSVAVTVG